MVAACSDSVTPPSGRAPMAFRIPLQFSLQEAADQAMPGDSVVFEVSFDIGSDEIVFDRNQTPIILMLPQGGKVGDARVGGDVMNPPRIVFENPRGTTVVGIVFDGTEVEVRGSGNLDLYDCGFKNASTQLLVQGSEGSLDVFVEECLFRTAGLFSIDVQGTARVTSVNNTLHNAGDCGIRLNDTATAEIRFCIISDYANFGIACLGSGGLIAGGSGCNDIHDSRTDTGSEPYSGCEPGEFDFHLSPQYCDAPGDNFRLLDTSPCAPLNSGSNCGDEKRIGARDPGCQPDTKF